MNARDSTAEESRTLFRNLMDLDDAMVVAITQASTRNFFIDLALAKFLVGSEVRS